MQRAFLSKSMAALALTLGMIVLPSSLPAHAQATSPADPTAPTVPAGSSNPSVASPETTAQPYNTTTTRERDFDWGWLGLLGLIGLAGLSRKHEEPVTRYREPDEASSTSTPRY